MSKVVVVSGANQGLGLALVRRLCYELGPDSIVYLTARSRERGEAALQQLHTEGPTPRFHLLDVDNNESVADLAVFLKQQHGGIDILIANAAARIRPDVTPAAQVAQFVTTNNHGTYRIITTFLPLLNDGARFIVVASAFGSLQYLPSQLHGTFDVERLSLEAIEKFGSHVKVVITF